MSEKPRKVGEPKAAYTAKKAAKDYMPAPEGRPTRLIDRETARKLTKEILDKHHELFRKLAQ